MEGNKGRERRERKDRMERVKMGWYTGKQEENVHEETKVLILLPGRKTFLSSDKKCHFLKKTKVASHHPSCMLKDHNCNTIILYLLYELQ